MSLVLEAPRGRADEATLANLLVLGKTTWRRTRSWMSLRMGRTDAASRALPQNADGPGRSKSAACAANAVARRSILLLPRPSASATSSCCCDIQKQHNGNGDDPVLQPDEARIHSIYYTADAIVRRSHFLLRGRRGALYEKKLKPTAAREEGGGHIILSMVFRQQGKHRTRRRGRWARYF